VFFVLKKKWVQKTTARKNLAIVFGLLILWDNTFNDLLLNSAH